MSPLPSLQRFVLCADDYALSPAVSLGIREALAAGRLSATGAMTTRRDWPEAARALADLQVDADVGLHLNLTLAAPLGPMPVLAPDGVFPAIGKLISASSRGQLPAQELRSEIARQLDSFVAEWGRAPDFVDGHQHVQVLPGIRDALLAELIARGWQGKLWLRDSSDRISAIVSRRVEVKKALILAWLGRDFAKTARRTGFVTNQGFSGFSAFDAGRDYAADFKMFLNAIGRRHLVMCHPGHIDAELIAADPVTQTRESELQFLMSPAFNDICQQQAATPARFLQTQP